MSADNSGQKYRREHDPYNGMETPEIRPDYIARQELSDAEKSASKDNQDNAEKSNRPSDRAIDKLKDVERSRLNDFSSNFQFNTGELTIEKFKEIYETENIWIDINSLQLESPKKYWYYHKGLSSRVYVDICSAKMLGKDIEIFFSYTEKEPNLVWIDNIQYKNQPMNSYWIPAKQINAWWITKKPVEYDELSPTPNRSFPWIGMRYKDIRSLYQWHPLIKKYKEISSIE